MEKVIKDGLVAVLISPGFGAGWYSWHYEIDLLFLPEIVKLVEENKQEEITQELLQDLGYPDVYMGGAKTLTIVWIPVGEKFIVNEYDGAESISLIKELPSITA